MTDINNLVIEGRLTTDITDRDFMYLQNGTAKMTIHIATNRSRKNGEEWVEETSFFDVVVWGKYAESLRTKLYKGCHIFAVGRLQQDRWVDQNGQKKSRVCIVSEQIQTESKGNNNGYNNGYDNYNDFN